MNSALAPRSYSQLAVKSADDLLFGVAPKPVRCGLGLEIGAGKVFPEVNFTLPTMSLTDETWPEVCQAAVFSPEATVEIARAIVSRTDPYDRTVAAGKAAIDVLKRGQRAGKLALARKEVSWLERIEDDLGNLPDKWEDLVTNLDSQYGGLYDKESYGLS